MGAERPGQIRPFGQPNFARDGVGGGSGKGQSFDEVAKAFSEKREQSTPNPPFTDERSVFKEEAPTVAQRRLALDFYTGIAPLERGEGSPLNPSPLDIVELHQLHLEAIRMSVNPGEIVSEYTLTHVIGASKRLLAYAEAAGLYDSHEVLVQERARHLSLEILLKYAARIEASGYPLVLQRDAVTLQQTLQEEASQFLEKTDPYYLPGLREGRIYAAAQYFPEEHPNEAIRTFTSKRVLGLMGEMQGVREGTEFFFDKKQFGVTEAIAYVTMFGHDDIAHYTLSNVYGTSKRQVLGVNVQSKWNDYARDIFAVHKLLTQAGANKRRP